MSAMIGLMAAYWLYDNWHRSRARVHRASCVWCNDGEGFHGTSGSTVGQWLPFDTYAQAAGAAMDAGRTDTADCPNCQPATSN